MPMPPFPLQQQQQPLPPPMPLAKVKIPKVVTQKRKKRAKRKGKKVTLKDPNKVTPKKKGGPPKTYKVQSGMFKGAFAQMKKHRDKQTTLYKEALIEVVSYVFVSWLFIYFFSLNSSPNKITERS
jgi:hypothetical protein